MYGNSIDLVFTLDSVRGARVQCENKVDRVSVHYGLLALEKACPSAIMRRMPITITEHVEIYKDGYRIRDKRGILRAFFKNGYSKNGCIGVFYDDKPTDPEDADSTAWLKALCQHTAPHLLPMVFSKNQKLPELDLEDADDYWEFVDVYSVREKRWFRLRGVGCGSIQVPVDGMATWEITFDDAEELTG